MNVSEAIKAQLFEHAKAEQPRESCGLIVSRDGVESYLPCANEAEANNHFVINHHQYAQAEDESEILAICHSHVFEPPNPSDADKVECERSGLPWVIINYPIGTLNVVMPTGYRAPLIGRAYSHGILDCYTLIKDYYAWELGISLPDFERPDNWWKTDAHDLYKDNFEKAGFYEVDFYDLKASDVILMQCVSDKMNHGAIYLGNQVILHHLYNRLSAREAYGGWYQKCSRKYLRHEKLRS